DPGPRADRLHRDGVLRLLELDSGAALRRRVEAHPSFKRLLRLQSTRGSPAQLVRELVAYAIVAGTRLDEAPPRDEAGYRRARDLLRGKADAAVDAAIEIGEAILERYD